MRLFAVAVLAALAAAPAAAQEKAEVRLKVKKGAKFTRSVEIKGDGQGTFAIGDDDRIKFVSPAHVNVSTRYVEEALEEKDGAPSKLRRLYLGRATRVDLGMFGGRWGSSPLIGRELTVEEGGARTAAGGGDEEELKREFAGDPCTRAFASGKPVAAGESWAGPPDAVRAWLDAEFRYLRFDEATLDCTLGAVETRNGRKVAVVKFEVKAECHIGVGEESEPKKTLRLGWKGEAEYAADAGLVVAVKAEGKLRHSKKADDAEEDDGTGIRKRDLSVSLEYKAAVVAGEADFAAKPDGKPEWMKVKKPADYPVPLR